MLPPSHCQRYREFRQALEKMHQQATATDLEVKVLRDQFQEIKKFFKSQIANLNSDELAPDDASRWQSVQTEIYKQMRLLETDMMLLQAARSSTTSLSRQKIVKDRINNLVQYCQALLLL
ncbi:heterocyst frequency control protein PatD [Lyngbya aestuarii]|uniref:heterocyst frequency control protein PatD n=1 Tax=Lyngbya aestuarii TaxID=118322 RepID=UPI00403DF52C